MLAAVSAIVVSGVAWVAVYRDVVRHPLDPAALTLYYLALQLLWRPVTLAVGLDEPFPTALFVDRDVAGLLVGGQAVVTLWLLALWAGARLLSPVSGPLTVVFPRVSTSLGRRALLLVTLASSAVALAATMWLWSRYGGPSGLIAASKVEREVVVSRALRSVPLLAALFGIATWFSYRGANPGVRFLALGLVGLNGYLSFTWGARDVPILSIVALIGGTLLFTGGPQAAAQHAAGWFRDRRWRRRFALVAVLALGTAFGLRAVRDTLLWDDVAPTIAGEGVVRQVAVATNNTFYDTLLLILDDWPDEYDFHDGADFVDGSVAAVPTVIAGPQEPFVSPAVQVAQTYIDRNNGFPATPVGDWYLNLGVPGVVVGGVVSGVLVRAAQVAMQRFTVDPLVWGFSLVFLLRIFPGGLWATSPPKWVAIGVPLLVVAVAVEVLARRDRRAAERTEVLGRGRVRRAVAAP